MKLFYQPGTNPDAFNENKMAHSDKTSFGCFTDNIIGKTAVNSKFIVQNFVI